MGEKEEPVEACELRSLLLCKLTGLGVAAPEVEVEAVEWVGHAAKMHHCCLCWARGHGHLLAAGGGGGTTTSILLSRWWCTLICMKKVGWIR